MANKTINRSTLVDALRQEVGLSRSETTELLEEFLRTVSDCLAKGGTIKIQNFGTFSVRHKKSRMGRNPKTGEEVPISARRVVVFKPSPKLKHRINNSEGPHKGSIERAAQELLDRHGDAALAVAKERVEVQERSGNHSDIDLSMLVLSQVERLVGPG